MKKYMHASGLKKTPRHKPKKTDTHLWKQYSKEYLNKRTAEWTSPFRCQMDYQYGCNSNHRTGLQDKRLEFCGTHWHDEHSHANEKSKKFKHDQIVFIHEAVGIAPKQSATIPSPNVCQAKGSTEAYTHMQHSMLRCIQRNLESAGD